MRLALTACSLQPLGKLVQTIGELFAKHVYVPAATLNRGQLDALQLHAQFIAFCGTSRALALTFLPLSPGLSTFPFAFTCANAIRFSARSLISFSFLAIAHTLSLLITQCLVNNLLDYLFARCAVRSLDCLSSLSTCCCNGGIQTCQFSSRSSNCIAKSTHISC